MNIRNQRIKASVRVLALLCAVLVLMPLALPVASATLEESEEGKQVKVGYMLLKNFQEEEILMQGGSVNIVRSGYGYDYLQMLRNYTGWEYDYVGGTESELIAKLERGEIDIMSHVARTPEREKTLLFSTEPQGRQTHYLYVDGPNEAIDPTDLSTLNGKRIGVIRGDFRTQVFLDWCDEQGLTCQTYEYDDIQAIHTAVHSGEVDAASASRLAVSACEDAKWRAILRFEDAPVYFAVKRGAEGEALLAEVNRAHEAILALNPDFGQELQQKYLRPGLSAAPLLTADEQAWLAARGELTVGYCDNRRPLAYTNEDGELAGLLRNYLDAMQQEYGMVFRTRAYASGTELLSALQRGEVDIISPVGYNFGMAEVYNLAVSDPITVESMVAVYKGYKGTEPKDIFETIAVLSNSITEKDYAKRCYPGSKWVLADSIEEAIELVAEDKAGCYIIRSSTWSWYKNEYPTLNDLQVLTLPNSNAVNMAIRNEDIALLPILNKGIALLSDADVNQAIVAHSDAREAITFWTYIRENWVMTAISVLAFLLAIGSVLLFFRLRTEKKYLKKLEEANRRAEEARREAERANLAKSTFLTSMSHDIRTPMNAIIGMTMLASKHLNSPDYVRSCLGKVTLASDHLLTLINDVLDINKIESGNLSLCPTVFSLADSIMNLANIGRHQIHEKDHRFEIRLHGIKQEYLFADELRINQVFINLLSNAVKYTPVGGCITIDIIQKPIPGDDGRVRMIYMIEDTGIGMSEEFQAHMYELFAMANRNARSMTGSGVGLSICKQLVELMEGTIECESTVGKGTRFTVTLELPIADRVVDELVLPPMKLLLVDDDEIFLTTASETLCELGLSPDCVASGEKAVAVVEQKHRDGKDYPLIIIDWQMPDMDGLETTKRIRRIVGEEVSIILISAYASEDIRDAALSAGANGFISKPFFRSTAYRSICDILGLSRTEKAETREQYDKVRGMKVLITEDNDLNWEIARELLAMYEVRADRAENGRICVDILEQTKPHTYDAVLMDIQMPVMDGYEATRVLRASERRDLAAIPIIAMTADAYTEDVLLCAEAGMDSHIPKPIDMERLIEVLSEVRGR